MSNYLIPAGTIYFDTVNPEKRRLDRNIELNNPDVWYNEKESYMMYRLWTEYKNDNIDDLELLQEYFIPIELRAFDEVDHEMFKIEEE